jgi:hypothetical protein
MPPTAPRTMKIAANRGSSHVRRGKRGRSFLGAARPYWESDPGDLDHHPLLPPSGEHAEENPSTRIAANRRREASRGELEGAV